MTFQELLKKTRGPSWIPPRRLVALDPGETTGYATFIDGKFSFTRQIDTKNNYKELMCEIIHFNSPLLVYEDYKIYPGLAKMHTLSGVPTLKLIGAIEFMCLMNNYQVFTQMASTAKGFVTDEKLKGWGFYLKGKPHSMDALRHGLHFLLFGKDI